MPNRLYVSAFFCERVLREVDHTLTAVRIVDFFDVKIPDAGAVPFVPRLEVCLVIMFRSDFPISQLPWSVRITDPKGAVTETDFPDTEITTSAVAAIATINIFINGVLDGVHMYEVLVEGQTVACRVPITIKHTKVPTSAPPQRTW